MIPRDSSFNSIWWKAHFTSSLLKTALWLSSCNTSSTVGIGWRSLMTASFACLISTQSLMSFFFGTITTGDTHGVGPCAYSIMSNFSNSSSFSSRFALWLKGIRRGCWATGLTVLSIGISSWKSLSLPIPWKHFSYVLSSLLWVFSSFTTLTVELLGSVILKPPSCVAVSRPRRACPFPLITMNLFSKLDGCCEASCYFKWFCTTIGKQLLLVCSWHTLHFTFLECLP